MIESSAPTGSSGVSCESFDLGINTCPAISATAMIGTLMRNTDPHQKCSSRSPEVTGPMAAPAPEMPAHMAIAFARSPVGNTLVRIDSVDGMTNAAPTPMIARDRVSTLVLSANAPSTEPARKIASPACSAPLRPKRSPSAAAVKSRPANTSP